MAERTLSLICLRVITFLGGLLLRTFLLGAGLHADAMPLTASYSPATDWHTEEGLPQNAVKKVVQTRDGYLWVATQEGLARFDGLHFTVFTTQNTPGLTSNNVQDMVEDKAGSLWLFANGGVCRYKDGVFADFTPPAALRGSIIHDIWLGVRGDLLAASDDYVYRDTGRALEIACAVRPVLHGLMASFTADDPQGGLWIADSQGNLYRVQNGRAQRIGTPRLLGREAVCTVYADGGQWIGGANGLFRWQHGHLIQIAGPKAFEQKAVSQIYPGREGVLWLYCGSVHVESILYGFKNGKVFLPRTHHILPSSNGIPILDNTDTLCLATKAGFCRWEQGQFVEYSLPEGSRASAGGSSLLSVWQDTQKTLWVGKNSGGLAALRSLENLPCRTYGVSEGLSGAEIVSVYADRQGTLWTSPQTGGLERFTGGRFVPVAFPGLAGKAWHAFAEDKQGGLWLSGTATVTANSTGITYRYWHGKFTDYTRQMETVGWRWGGLCSDASGAVWGITATGLSCWRDGRITHSKFGKEITQKNIIGWSLTSDGQGGVWMGMSNGLCHFSHGKFSFLGPEQGLPPVPLIALRQDQDGALWIASWGAGLWRLKAGRLTGIAQKDGLYADGILQIQEDYQDNIWLGSSKGVFRVRRSELNDYADGKSRALLCVPYSREDGATGGQSHAASQNGSCRAADGSLWFTTLGGLERIAPRAALSLSPLVKIERIVANGKVYSSLQSITAPPGEGSLEVDYTALDYAAPQTLRFRYRLKGFDEAWVDAGNRRAAYYTNLPPGRYAFQVRVCNADGIWGDTNTSVALTLRPAYFQTLWFRALSLLSFSCLCLSLYRARVYALNQRTLELEARVAARTTELEDVVDELQTMQAEMEAQNDELQNMQAELEAQNEELVVAQQTLSHTNLTLEGLATTDGLTGLKNHRTFQEKLEAEWQRTDFESRPLSVILMDIDHFKQYNDTYGHLAGDDVLRQLGQVLLDCSRDSDIVARYGGEEFVILMPHTNREGALLVAERFRMAVEAHHWPQRPITVSVGVATAAPEMLMPSALLALADKALYQSKERGRNRVTGGGSAPSSPALRLVVA